MGRAMRQFGIWALVGVLLGLAVGLWAVDTIVPLAPGGVAPAPGRVIRLGSAVVIPGRPIQAVMPSDGPAVALTITGGPDPTATPMALAVLRHARVHATFFFDGADMARYPDLVRQVVAAGHDVGTVGFGGDGLERRSPEDIGDRLRWSQTVLAGITGRGAHLVRLLNPATPAEFDGEEQRLAAALGPADRLVLADRAAGTVGSAARRIEAALPLPNRSAVVDVAMDADEPFRQRQVLTFLVAALVNRGTAPMSVSQWSGWRPTQATVQVSRTRRLVGGAFVTALGVSRSLRAFLAGAVLIVLIAGAARSLLSVALALRHAQRSHGTVPALTGQPRTLSVVIAARNEATVILGTLQRLRTAIHQSGASVEVIVVDDGSTDGTAAEIAAWAPAGVRLLAATGRGKGDALNQAIAEASGEIVVMLDADTHVTAASLGLIARAFDDPTLGAISGRIVVGNVRNLLGVFQALEYAIANGVERRMFAQLGVMSCVPGALGAFRKRAVLSVGGLPTDTVAEDTDLTLLLQSSGWRVGYRPDVVAYTFAPTRLGALWRQRVRWALGVVQNIAKHGRRSGTARSGRAVRLLVPYLVIFGGLSVFGPLVDGLAIWSLVTGQITRSLGLIAVTSGLGLLVTVTGLAVDRQPLRYALALPLQLTLYRPLFYCAQIRALQAACAGLLVRWGAPRTGAEPENATPEHAKTEDAETEDAKSLGGSRDPVVEGAPGDPVPQELGSGRDVPEPRPDVIELGGVVIDLRDRPTTRLWRSTDRVK